MKSTEKQYQIEDAKRFAQEYQTKKEVMSEEEYKEWLNK